ncbi:30445_t:CDS:2 [Gigaspora margarita]|uniref:30445_t:CDS:1 n=1 Tax=Gigaspora margarita TaxID=4874 RepID=A0ABN7W6U4_GIGMA|nr:30445_t:CDS:2 [Gigaspora margarita]
MAKRQKKLKFSDMGNNKKNAFYNSYNTLENHNNNFLSWDEKVEFELSALKDTTNIWNNSSTEYSGKDNEISQKPSTNITKPEPTLDMSTQVEQTTEREIAQHPIEKKTQDTNPYREKKANLIANNGKEKYDYAPTPDTEIDNVGIIMNNIEEQTQVTMEFPNEEDLDTNNTEVEMIDPTENDLVTPEMQISGVLDTKDKL